MRFLIRILGLLALAGAFAAAVLDGARWIANGAFAPTTAGALIGNLAPRAVANAQNLVDGRLGPKVWEDVIVQGLSAPLFVYLTALSALLFVLSRRPRPEPDW